MNIPLTSILGTATTIFTTKADLQAAVQEYDGYPHADSTAAVEKYGPIADWNVSAITDMSGLFNNCWYFNADISNWDTSLVTSMENMFLEAHVFNQPLSLDTSSVTHMDYMLLVRSRAPLHLPFEHPAFRRPRATRDVCAASAAASAAAALTPARLPTHTLRPHIADASFPLGRAHPPCPVPTSC